MSKILVTATTVPVEYQKSYWRRVKNHLLVRNFTAVEAVGLIRDFQEVIGRRNLNAIFHLNPEDIAKFIEEAND